MEYRKVFLLSVVVFLSACAGKNVEQPVPFRSRQESVSSGRLS